MIVPYEKVHQPYFERFNRQWKRIDDKGPGGVGDVAKLSGGGDSKPNFDDLDELGDNEPDSDDENLEDLPDLYDRND